MNTLFILPISILSLLLFTGIVTATILTTFNDNFDTKDNWNNLGDGGINFTISPANTMYVIHTYAGQSRYISQNDILSFDVPYNFSVDVQLNSSTVKIIRFIGTNNLDFILDTGLSQVYVQGCGYSGLISFDYGVGDWYNVTITVDTGYTGNFYIDGNLTYSGNVSGCAGQLSHIYLGGGVNGQSFRNLKFSSNPIPNLLTIGFGVAETNVNTETLFSLTTSLVGGIPPYNVTFFDTGYLPICSYVDQPATNYIVHLYGYAGTHYLGAIVNSSDGQSKIVYPFIQSDIIQSGTTPRTKNRVTDCGGILGSNTENLNGTIGSSIIPVTNPMTLVSGFITILTTPFAIWTALVLIIALASEHYVPQSHGKALMVVIVLGITVLSIFGIYPIWILILEVLFIGFLAFRYFSSGG